MHPARLDADRNGDGDGRGICRCMRGCLCPRHGRWGGGGFPLPAGVVGQCPVGPTAMQEGLPAYRADLASPTARATSGSPWHLPTRGMVGDRGARPDLFDHTYMPSFGHTCASTFFAIAARLFFQISRVTFVLAVTYSCVPNLDDVIIIIFLPFFPIYITVVQFIRGSKFLAFSRSEIGPT
jgi:hypothetical protein